MKKRKRKKKEYVSERKKTKHSGSHTCHNQKLFILLSCPQNDISFITVSAIRLLSGMLLWSRYEPENCPTLLALFCLIKSVARVEHMTESRLGANGTNDITDSQYLSLFILSYPLILFTMHVPVSFCCSFNCDFSLHRCIFLSSLFVLRVLVRFLGC